MIFECLREGKARKKGLHELLAILNITEREFYKHLRDERRAGYLILSEKDRGGGYWLYDGNYQELRDFYNMQRAGALDMLVTLKPVREELRRGGFIDGHDV